MLQCCALALWMLAQVSPGDSGELRVTVGDATGLPVQAAVELVSEANQIHRSLEADAQGRLVARQLPFGTYEIRVRHEGFSPFSGLIEIRSAVPLPYPVVLQLAPLQTQVTVSAGDTLVDSRQTAAVSRIGSDTIGTRTLASPGRALPDLISSQPGWLLEANGVLHPRGAEYQTQYIVDGVPLTDNRSPSFAPEIEADTVQSLGILTGGYPAEYGRKLGGVVEVVTAADERRGFHGRFTGAAGSFAMKAADASAAYGWNRAVAALSAGWSGTDRYLDPPVEENYFNHGSRLSLAGRLDANGTADDRAGLILRHGRSDFQVPNERIQQQAGQRQERSGDETLVQGSYQRVASSTVVWDVRGMWRNLSARLASNPASTPIRADQDRGVKEAYARATVAGHYGRHEWKLGADADFADMREAFSYTITDPDQFETGTLGRFSFQGTSPDREQSWFAQDRVSAGPWTLSAGLRWDHYALLVRDRAFSPRLALAWSRPERDLVVRVSYDRVFQTPSFENLLLSSSDEVETLSGHAVRLPVPPSRGNFYEAGLTKAWFGRVRVELGAYRRLIDQFADDDVLLNTGVTFPIAFAHADIKGTDVKLVLTDWRGLSGFLSYSNMVGTGFLPVVGGLLLGDDAEALDATDRFAVTQDQRNTVSGRAAYRLGARASISANVSYGSGLPVEFEGDQQDAIEQFGTRVVQHVDFERGRVRPFLILDASLGLSLTSSGNARLQADALNLTNRLRVINFAGVFSGTALAPPRSFAIRLELSAR